SGQPLEEAQVQEMAQRIGGQARRGSQIAKRLSAFAHSVDDPMCDLDLNALTEAIVALAAPLAKSKRVQLEIDPSTSATTVRTDPFRLQYALHLAIEEAVSLAPDGGKIVLSVSPEASGARLRIEGACHASSEGSDLCFLHELMREMGGGDDVSHQGREADHPARTSQTTAAKHLKPGDRQQVAARAGQNWKTGRRSGEVISPIPSARSVLYWRGRRDLNPQPPARQLEMAFPV
ncbi:sensor histidine kinase, partial [Candidatus Latescibacterota bacterium]